MLHSIYRCNAGVPRSNTESSSITEGSHKGHHHSLKSLKSTLSDFGHSLMAGYSADGYLNDFVLHGTSQPLSQFRESLVMDLSNIMKVHVY